MKRILTPREEEVMQVLWRLKRAFVKEILDQLPPPTPPYNTISSIVRKLEKEGMLGHKAFGKTYQYFPILKKSTYRSRVLKKLLNEYFQNSPQSLLSHFVKDEKVDVDELRDFLDNLES